MIFIRVFYFRQNLFMKTTLNVLLLALFLGSCTNDSTQDSDNNSGVSYYVAYGLQKNLKSNYYSGEAKLSELKEMSLDRSMDPGAQKRFKPNYAAAKSCEMAYAETVKQIDALRLSVMKSHLNANAIDKGYPNSTMPIDFDLLELREKKDLTSEIDQVQVKKVIENLIELRGTVITGLVTSNSYQEQSCSFSDPNLTMEDVRNLEGFNKKLSVACQNSRIAPDDLEIVRKLYTDFTVLASDMNTYLSDSKSTFDQFSALSLSLMQLYELRYMNYSIIRSRFGGRY